MGTILIMNMRGLDLNPLVVFEASIRLAKSRLPLMSWI